ncbi:MAG: metallophosphoesterase family protein [Pseudomonadota bacterium]
MNTDGRRIYAIGDVHGCLGALENRLGDIFADLAHRPHPAAEIIFVGDYTDRGPESRGTIERLLALEADARVATTFLFGNHDKQFLDYLENPSQMATPSLHWLNPRLGGNTTLASYGVANADAAEPGTSHAAFRAAVPASHIAFLQRTVLTRVIGTYLFVHAGIRPGVALAEQALTDLIWIRDPFLLDLTDHGHVVVHGHTPVRTVERLPNRIAIDTGAVFGGALSCLVLEDDKEALLTPEGPVPLTSHRAAY